MAKRDHVYRTYIPHPTLKRWRVAIVDHFGVNEKFIYWVELEHDTGGIVWAQESRETVVDELLLFEAVERCHAQADRLHALRTPHVLQLYGDRNDDKLRRRHPGDSDGGDPDVQGRRRRTNR